MIEITTGKLLILAMSIMAFGIGVFYLTYSGDLPYTTPKALTPRVVQFVGTATINLESHQQPIPLPEEKTQR